VLCGHSACGGCIAALGADRVGGVLDTWLSPLKAERKKHSAELESIKDDGERAIRLAEINVEKGVEVLLGNWTVEQGVRNGTLSVHGVVFDIKTGLIKNLGIGSGKATPDTVADAVAETK
jgi:carbonic anhydrase